MIHDCGHAETTPGCGGCDPGAIEFVIEDVGGALRRFDAARDMIRAHAEDAVNQPSHYTHGRIETIDAIEDWGLGYHLGNVVKYVSRCDHKGKPIEDLKKARWYLDREIARREGEK